MSARQFYRTFLTLSFFSETHFRLASFGLFLSMLDYSNWSSQIEQNIRLQDLVPTYSLETDSGFPLYSIWSKFITCSQYLSVCVDHHTLYCHKLSKAWQLHKIELSFLGLINSQVNRTWQIYSFYWIAVTIWFKQRRDCIWLGLEN